MISLDFLHFDTSTLKEILKEIFERYFNISSFYVILKNKKIIYIHKGTPILF